MFLMITYCHLLFTIYHNIYIQDVKDVHKTPAIGILKSKFRSYESQQPIAAHKSLSKNMTTSVTVASVTSEKVKLVIFVVVCCLKFVMYRTVVWCNMCSNLFTLLHVGTPEKI